MGKESLEAIYEKRLEEFAEKYGYDSFKIKRFVESCALKIAPLFNLYGWTYGDRVPSVYHLVDFIAADLVTEVLNPNNNAASSGMFQAAKLEYDDDPDELVIRFELGSIDLEELELS